ncbi:sugar phosphate isomerase/epimerase [Lachnospiraceae bacterium 54-53]
MPEQIFISGFADEISSDFDVQLETVSGLGMEYISLRSADGKGIADYTFHEAVKDLIPRLRQKGIEVSSLGSPVGKIKIDDEQGYERQLEQLEELCRISRALNCTYIRIFSFYMPEGQKPEAFTGQVLKKLRGFLDIARKYGIILIHENEKEIYGDTDVRCRELLESMKDPHFAAAFDFANFVQCGVDPKRAYEQLKPYVKYIHIKDAVAHRQENVVCGTGEGRIKEILREAFLMDGYTGFLTLEPHLAVFDSLASLETKDAKEIIKEDKAENGAEAYRIQYRALQKLLKEIK